MLVKVVWEGQTATLASEGGREGEKEGPDSSLKISSSQTGSNTLRCHYALLPRKRTLGEGWEGAGSLSSLVTHITMFLEGCMGCWAWLPFICRPALCLKEGKR